MTDLSIRFASLQVALMKCHFVSSKRFGGCSGIKPRDLYDLCSTSSWPHGILHTNTQVINSARRLSQIVAIICAVGIERKSEVHVISRHDLRSIRVLGQAGVMRVGRSCAGQVHGVLRRGTADVCDGRVPAAARRSADCRTVVGLRCDDLRGSGGCGRQHGGVRIVAFCSLSHICASMQKTKINLMKVCFISGHVKSYTHLQCQTHRPLFFVFQCGETLHADFETTPVIRWNSSTQWHFISLSNSAF